MAVLAAALAALTVTFTAPGGHAPRIGKSDTVGPKWWYTVRATEAGKLVHGKLTIQIVDPLGTVHAVQVGETTKPITNLPFPGVYRDYMIFPPESRGVPLRIRVTVVAGTQRRRLVYLVTPRA
jgi:hypothetical protein